jgi:hypothetical protein
MVKYQSNCDYILEIDSYWSLRFPNTKNKIREIEFGYFEENILKNEIKNNFFIIQDRALIFALYSITPLIKKKETLTLSQKRCPKIRKCKSYE